MSGNGINPSKYEDLIAYDKAMAEVSRLMATRFGRTAMRRVHLVQSAYHRCSAKYHEALLHHKCMVGGRYLRILYLKRSLKKIDEAMSLVNDVAQAYFGDALRKLRRAEARLAVKDRLDILSSMSNGPRIDSSLVNFMMDMADEMAVR